jgi:hypothetical protein
VDHREAMAAQGCRSHTIMASLDILTANSLILWMYDVLTTLSGSD